MRVAKLILDYNTHEYTDNLVRMLPDAMVIDNGSTVAHAKAIMHFDHNLGFTPGWNEAIRRLYNDYDAFLLMNNDIVTTPEMPIKLIQALENNPRLGIVSSSCNSPHDVMHRRGQSGLRYVPFVEFVAPMIRKEMFDLVGLLDEQFYRGWGVEYDFCWKVRRAGYSVGVVDDVEFRHIEHPTFDKLEGGRDKYFADGSHELRVGMEGRYGVDWRKDTQTMIGLTMVVCNEGKRLEDMLKYHKNLVDEIVIAVQQSEDNTLEVAKKYADTVIEVPCTGYCEAHRGLVSQRTQSEWQLCLDADEYLTPEFVAEMRQLPHRGPMGYRLTRRLFMDGVKTWEGDAHHRFYNKSNAKFLDEIHTEPQANDWNKVSGLDYIAINHVKSTEEQIGDELRCERVIEEKFKNSPTYSAKKALNVHLRNQEV